LALSERKKPYCHSKIGQGIAGGQQNPPTQHWLAQEDKITLETIGRVETITLKD
jgi:hypothetical protein